MKRNLLGLGLSLLFVTLLYSCKEKLTQKRKAEIAIEMLDSLNSSTFQGKGLDSLKAKSALKYKFFSDVIEVADARNYHQEYLRSTNPILNGNMVIHSLLLSRTDLERLYTPGVHGIRLYFIKEGNYFSIALVAVDGNDQNVLVDGSGNSLVVNKLDPCPNVCVNAGADRNHQSDLNYDPGRGLWLKPNLEQNDRIWVNNNDEPIEEDTEVLTKDTATKKN